MTRTFWFALLGLLAACAEIVPNYNFEATVAPARQVLADNGTLSYQFENGETLTIESDDQAAYVVSQGVLATIESEDAIAQLAYLRDETDPTTEISFARLNPTEMPETGTAQYRGDYYGAFVSVFTDPINGGTTEEPDLLGMSAQEIAFNVDFAERMIEGELTSRTAYILGFPFLFVISEESDLFLLPTRIDNSGSFEGIARYAQPDPEVEPREDGIYSGLIAGPEGDALIGEIRTPSDIGIFSAIEVDLEAMEPIENE